MVSYGDDSGKVKTKQYITPQKTKPGHVQRLGNRSLHRCEKSERPLRYPHFAEAKIW